MSREYSLHKKGCLIACSAAQIDRHRHWRMDHWAFGRVIDRIQEQNPENQFAKSFWVTTGPVGRTCFEFDEALSYALHSGLISYLSPEFTRMVLMVGGRTAGEILTRYSEKDAQDAMEVMTEYLKECP